MSGVRVMSAAFLAVVMLFGGRTSVAAESYHYGPEVVHLSGVVVLEVHYGPPNFGENPKTDTKGKYPILVLDKPITVIGDPNDEIDRTTYENVKRIQLARVNPALAIPVGRPVTVEGTLYESFTAHHYTDVLLLLTSLVSSK